MPNIEELEPMNGAPMGTRKGLRCWLGFHDPGWHIPLRFSLWTCRRCGDYVYEE